MEWNVPQTALAVLRQRGLSAAARTLGVDPATARRRLEALPHLPDLTAGSPSGRARQPIAEKLLALAGRMESLVRDEGAVGRPDSAVHGVVRITAGELIAVELLNPVFLELRARYPKLRLTVSANNAAEDLLRGQADIAVRLFEPDQKAIVTRRAGQVVFGFWAHRDYLAARGRPMSLEDLGRFDLVGSVHETPPLRAMRARGFAAPRGAFAFASDSLVTQLQAIRECLGIGVTISAVARLDKDLVQVLPEVENALDVFIAMHEDQRASRAVRSVFDALSAYFKSPTMQPELRGPAATPEDVVHSMRDLDWDDYRLVLTVSRTGDTSAAAGELGLAPATVRARLDRLGERLDGPLFSGPRRTLAPTTAAAPLMKVGEAMESRVAAFSAIAAEERGQATGVVRVAAPELIGQHVMIPAVGALRKLHPGLTVELVLVPGSSDLMDQDTEVAFLPFVPSSGDYIQTATRLVEFGLFAHRDYLIEHGAPASIEDLEGYDMLGIETENATLFASGSDAAARFLRAVMDDTGRRARFRFRSDSFTALLAALRAGLGIGQCQIALAGRYPELVRVLPEFAPVLQGYLTMRPWLVGVRRVEVVHEAMRAALDGRASGSRRP
jgi:DNA-binding transcriptional LysR family regulator